MTRSSSARVWFLFCGVIYVVLAWLMARSIHFAPIALDDHSELQAFAEVPFERVFALDLFGHLRPGKSALFWLLAQHPAWSANARGLILAAFIASAALWQGLCTPLMKSARWSLGAGLCWALNPISATGLSWLSSANLVLCAFGMLGFVFLAERETRVGAIGAFFSLLFAVSCHELALLTPLLWLAYRHAKGAASMRARLPLLAAALLPVLAFLVCYFLMRASAHRDYRSGLHSRAVLVLSAARYVFENLRLWFWLPGRFGVLLSDEPALHATRNVGSWIALITIPWLLWRLRDSALSFACLWSFVTLAPLTNFVPLGNTPVAMHYLILPGLGLALLLTRSAQRLASIVPVVPAIVLALYVGAQWPEQRRAFAAWSDASVLYTRTIENYPNHVEARVNLCAIYLETQRYAEAEALLASSLARWPNELGFVANQFKLLAETGHSDEALAWHDAHPELHVPAIWMLRGTLLTQNGHHREAADAFKRAFDGSAPGEDRFTAGYQLSIALVRAQHFAEARALIDRLLDEFPGRSELLSAKHLLAEQGD